MPKHKKDYSSKSSRRSKHRYHEESHDSRSRSTNLREHRRSSRESSTPLSREILRESLFEFFDLLKRREVPTPSEVSVDNHRPASLVPSEDVTTFSDGPSEVSVPNEGQTFEQTALMGRGGEPGMHLCRLKIFFYLRISGRGHNRLLFSSVPFLFQEVPHLSQRPIYLT